jgi:hypothetical protein
MMTSAPGVDPDPGLTGGGPIFHSRGTLGQFIALGDHVCGSFDACRSKDRGGRSFHIGISLLTRSWTSQQILLGWKR